MEDNLFEVTEEWFNSNRDHISGLNRAQAEALGERYPLKKGWKLRIIGKLITLEQKANYEMCKGLVYSIRKQKTKESRKTKILLVQKDTLELELEILKLQLEISRLKKKVKK